MTKLMKGHTWSKGKARLHYPAVAEIKYDEIRCDIRLNSTDGLAFRSFADKPLHNMSFLAGNVREFMVHSGLSRLDCGVLANNSYNDSYRWVRSSKGVPGDLSSGLVQLVLFDSPNHGHIPYGERLHLLDALAARGRECGIPFIRPIRIQVRDAEQVDAAFAEALHRKYEGLMVKDLRGLYELGKRTFTWLKYKPEEDADGVITGINRATSIEGLPLDRAGSISIVCEDGSTADVAGINHELGRLMLAHPERFVGEWAEFKYMEIDRQGGYRHPRFHRIREAKQ